MIWSSTFLLAIFIYWDYITSFCSLASFVVIVATIYFYLLSVWKSIGSSLFVHTSGFTILLRFIVPRSRYIDFCPIIPEKGSWLSLRTSLKKRRAVPWSARRRFSVSCLRHGHPGDRIAIVFSTATRFNFAASDTFSRKRDR